MHDYQLERLNTRSFEQLTQALGLEVLGKQLRIFGDGPDGGREATFEGSVKYPEGNKQWNGYGIVQAKFRQQPDSLAKKNADWVITQLKGEFKKFKPRSKSKNPLKPGDRICSEYYVLATNVALRPAANKGGKDRVRALFDGFKKTHGLKDYAIWDGDQIRRFLDAAPAIRITYAAWLLPGDVLAQMMDHLKLKDTDFAKTIRRYLESELLDDQFARLGQGGYTDANAIPLSAVFVDLPVDLATASHSRVEAESDDAHNADKQKAKRPMFLKMFMEEGRQVLKPSACSRRYSEQFSSTRTPGRVVLIGGPGQGKTTLGQFTCQLFRAALLKATAANYSAEVTQALILIEQQSQALPKPQALRYPLRIDLKRLAEALKGKGDLVSNSVLEFLVRHISKRTDSQLTKDQFRLWLASYPWLLVLDGLDEVPPSSNRVDVINAIRDFVSIEANQLDADLLILATTRPQGYSSEFDPALYWHLPLAPLNAAEALDYGAKLARARHPNLKSRIEELIKSLTRATTNPSTVRLMESPLQVTIMLALIEGGGDPPEQRWKLFHDYYDVIYRREKERGTPFSALLGKYEPDIHWLHHRAGWVLHRRNAAAGATAARLTHAEFETMVDTRLQIRGHRDPTNRADLVSQIREAATNRLVFLVGNTENEIGFEIRSLQEFMAAEHCFDGSEGCVQATIQVIAPHPFWRNVFLFAAGRIFFEKESLIDSLIAICDRLNEPLTDPAHGAIFTGSRLALSMLKDGVARNQPENCRALARCAARLLDTGNTADVDDLARLFSSETREVWTEELLTRLRGPRSDFLYTSWLVCIALARQKYKWASDTLAVHFPWRHQDTETFLSLLLQECGSAWEGLRDAIDKHVFVFSPTIWFATREFDVGSELSNLEFIAHILGTLRVRDSGNEVPILDENANPTCNSLLASVPIEAWANLQLPIANLELVHPAWRILHAVSKFAREYTPVGLAMHLPEMLNGNQYLLDWSIRISLPWQIRACLAASKSGISLAEVAHAINSFDIGDAQDWVQWEAEDDQGVRICDLGLPRGPLSISREHQGARFEGATWSHRSCGVENLDFVRTFCRSTPHLSPDSELLSELVNVACFGLFEASPSWPCEMSSTIQEFVTECVKLKVALPRTLPAAIVKSCIDITEKMKLLALIGNAAMAHSWFPDKPKEKMQANDAGVQIVNTLLHYENAPSVLCALAALPPLPFAESLPKSVLDVCRNLEGVFKQAAIALEANALIWRRAPHEVADEVLSLSERYPRHLSELLEFIDSQGIGGAHLELFLIALQKIPSPPAFKDLQLKVAALLVKLVERRPAIDALPDPSTRKASSEIAASTL